MSRFPEMMTGQGSKVETGGDGRAGGLRFGGDEWMYAGESESGIYAVLGVGKEEVEVLGIEEKTSV